MACLFVLFLSLGGGGVVGMCFFWVGSGLMYLFQCVKVMTWVWSCDGVMIWA